MQTLAQHALPGIVFASAVGALVMCLLVLRYGFTPLQGVSEKRLGWAVFMTRVGHAAAGVCFAVTAMLGTVALVDEARSRAAAARPPQMLIDLTGSVGALSDRVGALTDRVRAAEQAQTTTSTRLDATASQAAALDRRVTVADSVARRAEVEAGQALLGVRRLERAAERGPTSAPSRGQAPIGSPSAYRTPPTAPKPGPTSGAPAAPPGPRAAAVPMAPPAAPTVSDGGAAAVRSDDPPAATEVHRVVAPPAHAATARPPTLSADKLKNDWETVKREAADGPRQFRESIERFKQQWKSLFSGK